MKQWFFRKTPNWIVLIVLTAVVAGAVLFGGVVKYRAEGGRRLGIAGASALRVAELPKRLLDALRPVPPSPPPRLRSREQRFDGMSGLVLAEGAAFRDDGYLLLTRYDENRQAWTVELLDLGRRTIVHAWHPDSHGPIRIVSAYPLEDGSLLHVPDFRGPLVMLDGCSRVRWSLDDVRYHHSIERDADGHFWVPYDLPDRALDFHEEGLARISATGRVLSLSPLSRLLASGRHRHLLYSMEHHLDDPMHINDIQPVPEDGPSWRRGDLLVSLRSRSTVLLYRPANDEIVWLASGPWMHQHDVNIVGPRQMSVFSNNAIRTRGGAQQVLGANEVHLYDPASNTARSPWRQALQQHRVRTPVAGRATVLANGDVFVEETVYGRALRVNADGSLRWTYVNRGRDGLVYRLSWSRYLAAEVGARIAASVAALGCP